MGAAPSKGVGHDGGIMLEQTYNDVVHYTHATNADEFERVLALLPAVVKSRLFQEVQKFSDAHRYDPETKCAYYFSSQGSGVTIWSWNHVYRPHEAGELIFRVVNSQTPLDEKLANELYALATGRTVTSLQPNPADNSAETFTTRARP